MCVHVVIYVSRREKQQKKVNSVNGSSLGFWPTAFAVSYYSKKYSALIIKITVNSSFPLNRLH